MRTFDVAPDVRVTGKRQRKPPGEWWLSHGLEIESEGEEAQDLDTMNFSQHGEVEMTQKNDSKPAQKPNGKKATPAGLSGQIPNQEEQQHTGRTQKNKSQPGQKPNKKKATPVGLSGQIPNQEEQQQTDYLNFDPVPSKSPLGGTTITTGDLFIEALI